MAKAFPGVFLQLLRNTLQMAMAAVQSACIGSAISGIHRAAEKGSSRKPVPRRRASVKRVLRTSHQPLGDVFSDDLPTLAFGSDVVVVLEVVRQLLDLHLLEASFLEHLFGLLLAPHRAEPLTTLS